MTTHSAQQGNLFSGFASRRFFSTAFLGTVLATSCLAGGALAASSGWVVTKVEERQEGAAPYCALTRKLDDVMLTVGKSVEGQSSLALDFGQKTLDPSKVYRVTLKAGSAERLEVEVKPMTDRVFVLNLDKMVDLDSAFRGAPTLQFGYDGVSRALSLSDWDAGSKEIGACLASLNEAAAPVVAAEDKPETQPEAQGLVDKLLSEKASEIPAPAAQPQTPASAEKVVAQLDAQAAEKKKAVTPVLSSSEKKAELIATPGDQPNVTSETKLAKNVPVVPVVDPAAHQAALEARDRMASELAKVKGEMSVLQASQMDRVAVLEKEKGDLSAQVRRLQTDLEGAQKAAQSTKAVSDQGAKLAALEKERADFQAQSEGLKAQVGQLTADKGALDEKIKKLEADLKAVPAPVVVDPDALEKSNAQVSELSAQVADLKSANDRLQRETDALKAAAAGPVDTADVDQRVETLSAENVRLREQLAQASTSPEDVKATVAAELPLRQQLRQLRGDNNVLAARNRELEAQIDGLRRGGEQVELKATQGAPDVEQAVRRYQEAEREVSRLSIALKEQKAVCEKQKKDIEFMLFDPKRAKEGQIAVLNAMEDQLARSSGPTASSVKGKGADGSSKVVPDSKSVPSLVPPAKDSAPVQPAPEPVVSRAMPSLMGVIRGWLDSAGMDPSGALTSVSSNPFGTGEAVRWETGSLAGLAVRDVMPKGDNLEGQVQARISRLKTACKGDFDASPGEQTATYVTYDAACLAGPNSTSAAVLFYQKDGVLTIVSNESAPNVMDQAMAARDRFLAALTGK